MSGISNASSSYGESPIEKKLRDTCLQCLDKSGLIHGMIVNQRFTRHFTVSCSWKLERRINERQQRNSNSLIHLSLSAFYYATLPAVPAYWIHTMPNFRFIRHESWKNLLKSKSCKIKPKKYSPIACDEARSVSMGLGTKQSLILTPSIDRFSTLFHSDEGFRSLRLRLNSGNTSCPLAQNYTFTVGFRITSSKTYTLQKQ